MRCPNCGSHIPLFNKTARPEGPDYVIVCQSCGIHLRWGASSFAKGFLKFALAMIGTEILIEILIAATIGSSDVLRYVILGVAAWYFANRFIFKLERA